MRHSLLLYTAMIDSFAAL